MNFDGNAILYNGEYHDGDPSQGIPASLVTAKWMNAVTQELLAILTAASITPDINDNDQVVTGIQSLIQAAINSVINAAPGALDTLDELAAALGDDANFATTMTNALAAKVAIASIVNNLTSAATNVPLSANMGKVLNDALVALTNAYNAHNHNDSYYTETEVNSLLSGKANSSHDHNYWTVYSGGNGIGWARHSLTGITILTGRVTSIGPTAVKTANYGVTFSDIWIATGNRRTTQYNNGSNYVDHYNATTVWARNGHASDTTDFDYIAIGIS